MLDDIMRQFNIDATLFGQFSGIYYIGYSALHLPIGIMLDRFGPRKVMSGCIILTVIGLLPLIYAEHWAYPIFGRLLIGAGSSAAILGVFKIVRIIFSEKLFPRMLSLSVTIGLIGAIWGGGPVNYMLETLGFHRVVQIFALGGLALALITYWIIPNSEKVSKSSILCDLKEVFGNKRVIALCLFAGLMVGPLEGFADVWGTAFLKQVYGYDSTISSSLPSLIFVGMCFGGPLLSLISEKVGGALVTIVGAGVIMSVSFVALLIWHPSSSVISLNFILVGICCAYQILAIYKASTFVREQVAGLTTATANMIIMTFGYAFHTLIAALINAMGGPNSSIALNGGIAVIPIALFIGTAGFIYLSFKENRLAQGALRSDGNVEG